MKAGLFRAREADEFTTRERLRILEITTGRDDPALSIARARVAPGGTTELHSLTGVDERYLVVSGRGEMNLDANDEWFEIDPGDVVAIPAGTAQRVRNPHREDLVFYCICSPAFSESCYRSLE